MTTKLKTGQRTTKHSWDGDTCRFCGLLRYPTGDLGEMAFCYSDEQVGGLSPAPCPGRIFQLDADDVRSLSRWLGTVDPRDWLVSIQAIQVALLVDPKSPRDWPELVRRGAP